MTNEVTVAKMPGMQLAITGKQFLRAAFQQAFERVGGIDAIVDWANPEVEVVGEDGVKRTERKRNNENFGALLSLMARLEPKEINVKDDRSIESTIDAIEASYVPVPDEPSSD